MRVIFDADPVVYGAGFAAERKTWLVVAQAKDGTLRDAFFEPHPDKGGAKEQANAWLEAEGLEAVSWEPQIIAEPVEFALQAVGTTIRGALKSIAKQYGLEVRDLQVTILLSGPGNFRAELAKVAEYKGNRDPEHKPVHYQAIRNYLTDTWGAIVVIGREADDEASILAHQHLRELNYERADYVICTIDKDLDQIPGPHYDYKKHVHYVVNELQAWRWFWVQVLAGDSTDNIPGCYRVGTKTAEAMVDDWLGEYDGPFETPPYEAFLWNNVVATYEAAELRYGAKCPWVGKMTAAEAALETARLVRMQHHAGELWEAPR